MGSLRAALGLLSVAPLAAASNGLGSDEASGTAVLTDPYGEFTFEQPSGERLGDDSSPTLDAEIGFREQMGLRSDTEYVKGILAQPDVDLLRKYSFALTAEEQADVGRRFDLQLVVSSLDATYQAQRPDEFVGLSIDQARGGEITVVATSEAVALEIAAEVAAATSGAPVRTAVAGMSMDAGIKVTDRIAQDQEEWVAVGALVESVDYDATGGVIHVHLRETSDLEQAKAFALDRYGPAVIVTLEPPVGHALLGRSDLPLRAGSDVQSPVGHCTAGWQIDSGGSRYMISAGHCEMDVFGVAFCNDFSWEVGGIGGDHDIGRCEDNGLWGGLTTDLVLVRTDNLAVGPGKVNCVIDGSICRQISGGKNVADGVVLLKSGRSTGVTSFTSENQYDCKPTGDYLPCNQQRGDSPNGDLTACGGDSGSAVYGVASDGRAVVAGILVGGEHKECSGTDDKLWFHRFSTVDAEFGGTIP